MPLDTTTAPPRPAHWKRRLTMSDVLWLVAVFAVDLALLRASLRFWLPPLVPMLGMLVILVFFVWRYVPRSWDRPCYVAALLLYCIFLGVMVVSYNPILAGPLLKFLGVDS
jgi:hypothetical protein